MRITHERVRAILDYNPETGVITWIVPPKYRPVKIGDRAGHPDPYKGKNYRTITIDGIKYKEHRLIYFWMTSQWPPCQIDHKNTDQSDNRWENLRLADGSQNQANRPHRNKLGYKGVTKKTFVNSVKYQAMIHHRGKSIYLGLFDTPEEANDRYFEEAKKLHGEFSHKG